MRGALAASTSSRGATVSVSAARPPSAVRGAAGGCSSSGRELPTPPPPFSQRRRRFAGGGDRRRILVSVPPSFAAADGSFSAGGGGGEEDDIADPFALAEGDIPAEVAAQFAAAVGGGGEGGGDSGGEREQFPSTSSSSTFDEEQFEGGSGKVRAFSRVGEKDPYRLLGVQRDASFEEIQDARNYLALTYRSHERSREAVEGAFDSILKERMRLRHKLGFRPPKAGRKADFSQPKKRSLAARAGMLLDPLVTKPTVVNAGSIFLALALWAALQANSSDPTFPVLGSICYCGWRVFDKRRKRGDPDGKEFFGGSPIWGALGTTLLALLAGFVLSLAVVRVADAAAAALPALTRLRPASCGLFVICMTLGAVSIFFR